MYKQWLKKKNNKKISTHRGRITFAWIWGLTGITFARSSTHNIIKIHFFNIKP
jgi:hypothetical protein